VFAVLIVGLGVGVGFASSALSDEVVATMPNCAERWNVSRLIDPSELGYETAAEAAEEVRQAIVDGGGRPDGRRLEALSQLDENTFYIPVAETPELDADALIEVTAVPAGGFLATNAVFCAGSIPEPFPWGLE